MTCNESVACVLIGMTPPPPPFPPPNSPPVVAAQKLDEEEVVVVVEADAYLLAVNARARRV